MGRRLGGGPGAAAGRRGPKTALAPSSRGATAMCARATGPAGGHARNRPRPPRLMPSGASIRHLPVAWRVSGARSGQGGPYQSPGDYLVPGAGGATDTTRLATIWCQERAGRPLPVAAPFWAALAAPAWCCDPPQAMVRAARRGPRRWAHLRAAAAPRRARRPSRGPGSQASQTSRLPATPRHPR